MTFLNNSLLPHHHGLDLTSVVIYDMLRRVLFPAPSLRVGPVAKVTIDVSPPAVAVGLDAVGASGGADSRILPAPLLLGPAPSSMIRRWPPNRQTRSTAACYSACGAPPERSETT